MTVTVAASFDVGDRDGDADGDSSAEPGDTDVLVLGETLDDFDADGVVEHVFVGDAVAEGARKRRMTCKRRAAMTDAIEKAQGEITYSAAQRQAGSASIMMMIRRRLI